MLRHRLFVAMVLVAALVAPDARSATLTLDTGKAVSLQQGATGSFVFSFTNTGTSLADTFLGWTLGVQLLPAGGNTGILTLGDLTQPAANPMPVGPIDVLEPTISILVGGATINGTPNYYTMGIAATEVAGTVNAATSYNMGDLALTASGNASGVWNVYAVQQSSGERSHWGDVNDPFTPIDFSNLARGAGNSSVLLGTVTVNAVPEPGSLALCAVAAGLAAACRWRRRAGRRAA